MRRYVVGIPILGLAHFALYMVLFFGAMAEGDVAGPRTRLMDLLAISLNVLGFPLINAWPALPALHDMMKGEGGLYLLAGSNSIVWGAFLTWVYRRIRAPRGPVAG